MQVHKALIKLKHLGEIPLFKEIIMVILAIVLIFLFQSYTISLLFTGEKRVMKEELSKAALWSIGYWSGKEGMKVDGIERFWGYDAKTHELTIGIGGKEYYFEIDSLEGAFEMDAIVAYDVNLCNPITLARLDSLMKFRVGKRIQNLSIAFRRVDSLGNTKEIYPPGNTRYVDMEEAGFVRLGYISGEKVGVLFDFTWKDFLSRFWWQVGGIALGGAVLIVLIVLFASKIWKQIQLKQLQEKCLGQRMHDLKRPVSAIEGVLFRLQQKGDNVKVEDVCDFGLEEAALLKREMSNVLQLVVLMYRKRVEWQDVPLKEELEALFAEERFANPEKEIKRELDYRLPEILLLSEQFLYALRNLMDNAVKYSGREVFIRVACYLEGDALVVSVADEGKGIAKKDLPYIFEEYWRVGKDRKEKGFGLGLASVRKIVKRHRGKIFVESELGKGSKFTIKLYHYGRKNKALVRGGRGEHTGYLHADIVGAGV